MPLPTGIGWELKFLFYTLTSSVVIMGSLVTYFIARYIKKSDDGHTNIKTILNGHGDMLNKHETKMSNLNNQMQKTAMKMDTAATKLESSNFKFQQGIMRDLHDMHKSTTKIKGDLTECNLKVGSIGKQVTEITDTISKHQKTLSLSAQVMVKQKNRIDKVETEVKELNHGLVLVRNKKQTKA